MLDIALQLIGGGFAAPAGCIGAFGEGLWPLSPARQRADARLAHMVRDIVCVVCVFCAAIFIDEGRQAQLCAQFHEGCLEPLHVSVRGDHGPADRIGGGISLADRAVEQADAIMALEIGRIGQDEICIGHHLGSVGIGVDDVRDLVAAVGLFVREHVHHAFGIHRRIPRHVGHVEE